jgi:hypothetical protein
MSDEIDGYPARRGLRGSVWVLREKLRVICRRGNQHHGLGDVLPRLIEFDRPEKRFELACGERASANTRTVEADCAVW